MGRRVIWSAPMVSALRLLRDKGVPLYECAEKLGVSYPTAVQFARSVGLAGRMNRGRVPGRLAKAGAP